MGMIGNRQRLRKESTIIAVDFDGTCVTHDFPQVGRNIGAAPVLKDLTENGHKLILFTMRCNHDFEPSNTNQPDIIAKPGNYLKDAVSWFETNNISLWGIQTNPTQHEWTSSPKAYAHFIIDDIALGTPTTTIYSGTEGNVSHQKPFINWNEMRWLLYKEGLLTKEQMEAYEQL